MNIPPDAPDQHARELELLNTIAEALSQAHDVQQALARTLAQVAELLGLRTGWIWLIDSETGHFYNAVVQNLPPYLRDPVRMTGRSCWCIDSYRDGELTAQNISVMECSRLRPAAKLHEDEATAGLAYHASIPLTFQGKQLGIMNVAAPSWRELTAEELRLLSTIAYQVATSIERARLAEERARLVRSEERGRLAREIHDTLAQDLTGIALQIEGAMRHLETQPAEARRRLDRALELARAGLDQARRSVENLRAAPLDGKPLAEALAALSRAFTADTGVRVQLALDRAGGLSSEAEAELFRIAQEALNNVRRHAAATEVALDLRTARQRTTLSISDNGQGFDPRRRPAGRYGLVGMRERARLLGGRLRISSAPGQGTTIVASIPMPREGGR